MNWQKKLPRRKKFVSKKKLPVRLKKIDLNSFVLSRKEFVSKKKLKGLGKKRLPVRQRKIGLKSFALKKKNAKD